MTVTGTNADRAEADNLEALADNLSKRGFETRLDTPEGRMPSLLVTNPQASRLSETIMTGHGWFWWSWAERITAVADVAAAADVIARVLAYGSSST